MVVKIQGTFTVMVTAFDDNGSVDLDAQARFTDLSLIHISEPTRRP